MDIPAWIRNLFAAIDARDAEAFAGFLTEQGLFRYGSQPPVAGRDAVRAHVAAFFAGLAGLRHEVQGFWWGEPGRTCFVQGQVNYTLPGGGQVSLPFLNLFHMQGERVAEYLVYADPTPMFGAG